MKNMFVQALSRWVCPSLIATAFCALLTDSLAENLGPLFMPATTDHLGQKYEFYGDQTKGTLIITKDGVSTFYRYTGNPKVGTTLNKMETPPAQQDPPKTVPPATTTPVQPQPTSPSTHKLGKLFVQPTEDPTTGKRFSFYGDDKKGTLVISQNGNDKYYRYEGDPRKSTTLTPISNPNLPQKTVPQQPVQPKDLQPKDKAHTVSPGELPDIRPVDVPMSVSPHPMAQQLKDKKQTVENGVTLTSYTDPDPNQGSDYKTRNALLGCKDGGAFIGDRIWRKPPRIEKVDFNSGTYENQLPSLPKDADYAYRKGPYTLSGQRTEKGRQWYLYDALSGPMTNMLPPSLGYVPTGSDGKVSMTKNPNYVLISKGKGADNWKGFKSSFEVTVFDVRTRQQTKKSFNNVFPPENLTPKGNWIIIKKKHRSSDSFDSQTVAYNFKTGETKTILDGKTAGPIFSEDGSKMYLIDSQERYHFYDLPSLNKISSLVRGGYYEDGYFSRDGSQLIIQENEKATRGSRIQAFKIYDVNTGRMLKRVEVPKGAGKDRLYDFCVLGDNEIAARGYSEGKAKLFHLKY